MDATLVQTAHLQHGDHELLALVKASLDLQQRKRQRERRGKHDAGTRSKGGACAAHRCTRLPRASLARSSSVGSFMSSLVLPASSMSDTCGAWRVSDRRVIRGATLQGTHEAVVGDVQQAVVLARHVRHLRGVWQ